MFNDPVWLHRACPHVEGAHCSAVLLQTGPFAEEVLLPGRRRWQPALFNIRAIACNCAHIWFASAADNVSAATSSSLTSESSTPGAVANMTRPRPFPVPIRGSASPAAAPDRCVPCWLRRSACSLERGAKRPPRTSMSLPATSIRAACSLPRRARARLACCRKRLASSRCTASGRHVKHGRTTRWNSSCSRTCHGSRCGRHLLDQTGQILRHYDYAVNETARASGEIDGLTQSRKATDPHPASGFEASITARMPR